MGDAPAADRRGATILLGAIFLPAGSIAIDMALRPYPYPMLAVSTVLAITAAGVAAWTGFRLTCMAQAGSIQATILLKAAVAALTAAAAINALFGLLQYLQVPAPKIIVSELVLLGRSYGNLRQPNQYALLISWGYLVGLALMCFKLRSSESPDLLARSLAWLVGVVVAVAVAVSGSRAGGLFLWVIGAAGLVLPHLSRFQRLIMVGVPLIHAAAWVVLVSLDLRDVLPFYSTLRSFGEGADFNQGDVSNSRFGVWRDIWELVRQHPWGGYGFHRLNQTLVTAAPSHTVLLNFVHAHNVFLHWAFEFGIPMVLAWVTLMVAWIWRIRRALVHPLGMWLGIGLLLIVLGNMLEHPWWHPHFLLPCTFAAGALTAFSPSPQRELREFESGAIGKVLLVSGLLMVLMSVQFAQDIQRVKPVYRHSAAQIPLTDRLQDAYETVWLAHWVDQAVVGTLIPTTIESAVVQCRLGKKVQTFFLGEYAALNTALACAEGGEIDYGAKLVAAVRIDAPHVISAYVRRLPKPQRELFDKLLLRADAYQPSTP